MALPTEKTKKNTDFNRRKILLFGRGKAGKTALIAGLPVKSLFVTFERRHDDIEAYIAECSEWTDWLVILEELKKKNDYEMIVIDTLDQAFVMYRKHFLAINGKDSEYDFAQRGKGWLDLRWGFRNFLNDLKMLDKGLVFIMHYEEFEIAEKNIVTRFYCPGDKHVRTEIEGTCDAMWYMGSEKGAVKNGDGKDTIGDVRYIQMERTTGIDCGSGFSMPAKITFANCDATKAAARIYKAYQIHNVKNENGKGKK